MYLEISAIYRSHEITKTEFLLNLKKFLQDVENHDNHLIVGDFNMNLLDLDLINQEYLSSLL